MAMPWVAIGPDATSNWLPHQQKLAVARYFNQQK
jgi:hypothetical protein